MFASIDTTLEQSQSILQRLNSSLFSIRSLTLLTVLLLIAYIGGRLAATLLRRLTTAISKQADKSENLHRVNSLRRMETLIVLSVAVVRTLFIALAVYFWWSYIHPFEQPTAIIGASAVIAIVLGGALSPVLRDLASGSVMMAEHWYGVGDHVKIEPFSDLQGVVERVTLRSTRIRGLTGEVVWVNNQNIQAVRITPKGTRKVAIELFVSDLDKGMDLIEQTNIRLPIGQLMVINPLTVMTSTRASDHVWHLTAIGETAPGREWLLERHAVLLLSEIDEEMHEKSVLLNEPIARFADSEAELRFARSIKNASKTPVRRREVMRNAVRKATRSSSHRPKN